MILLYLDHFEIAAHCVSAISHDPHAAPRNRSLTCGDAPVNVELRVHENESNSFGVGGGRGCELFLLSMWAPHTAALSACISAVDALGGTAIELELFAEAPFEKLKSLYWTVLGTRLFSLSLWLPRLFLGHSREHLRGSGYPLRNLIDDHHSQQNR